MEEIERAICAAIKAEEQRALARYYESLEIPAEFS